METSTIFLQPLPKRLVEPSPAKRPARVPDASKFPARPQKGSKGKGAGSQSFRNCGKMGHTYKALCGGRRNPDMGNAMVRGIQAVVKNMANCKLHGPAPREDDSAGIGTPADTACEFFELCAGSAMLSRCFKDNGFDIRGSFQESLPADGSNLLG